MTLISSLGRFKLRRLLGRGGMGDVYLAWDPDRGEEVALKVINLQHSLDPEMMEAERSGLALQQALARVAPAVAAVYEMGEDDQYFWASLEYIPGNDLSEILKESGPIAENIVIELALQLCKFLEVAHGFSAELGGHWVQGVVHGDIKPQNIRIQPGGRLRLLDFGVAKHLTATRRVTRNTFLQSVL